MAIGCEIHPDQIVPDLPAGAMCLKCAAAIEAYRKAYMEEFWKNWGDPQKFQGPWPPRSQPEPLVAQMMPLPSGYPEKWAKLRKNLRDELKKTALLSETREGAAVRGVLSAVLEKMLDLEDESEDPPSQSGVL